MPGTGKLVLTGQLGDVMKESAQAAVSFLRSRSAELGLPDDYFSKHDLHIHVPAGAVPKDGPSAGISLATSIVSLLTNRKVDSGLAMTGEITLTGQVLPIGGLKEKVLANFRFVVDTGQPLWYRGPANAPHDSEIYELERIFLPLAADGANVDMLLNMSILYVSSGDVW